MILPYVTAAVEFGYQQLFELKESTDGEYA